MSTNNNPSVPKPVDVYELVTDRIIELLEIGTVPWRIPWTTTGIPMNAISKRPYRGINVMLLNSLFYPHNLFLTWNQIKSINASVLPGEKGSIIVFTKTIEKDEVKDGKIVTEKKYFLRYYKVWNIEQCKDIPIAYHPKINEELPPLPECAAIVENMKNAPRIVHKQAQAYYVPAEDYINMPRKNAFTSNDDYYGTLFHELVHATGHQTRLSRKEVFENPYYGTESYSQEELVAEMGACYLKSYAGLRIEDMSYNASYIHSWLRVFKNDKKILIQAASKAQQAVEYILHPRVPEAVSKEQEEELEVGIAA